MHSVIASYFAAPLYFLIRRGCDVRDLKMVLYTFYCLILYRAVALSRIVALWAESAVEVF